ncbi:hypothetical protein VSH64_40770 [Amycolatopsis rhabdoformis]|uniref:Uncharacterized protein n=1 Tax=Amycolatopsis rhabdoformis TaxID=1448059 RepID=A0ABZ1I3W7_9PSEU|nr:hypothetical protein [Amycolatopsis rhabdoformis]WSE29085.1 hypothetical protein VSH64_40770 [Amycolatopsis rhabdoformis]
MAEQRDHGQPDNPPGPGPRPADGPQPIPGGLPQPSGQGQWPASQQQPPSPGTGADGANLPALPSAPDQPPLDAAQLEQFRQFQQFQDYLRFTQAQQGNQPAPQTDAGLVPAGSRQPQTQQGWEPPVPPERPGALERYEEPRRRRPVPRWLKRLGGKILGWVIVLLILGIAATWAYRHFFPSDEGKSSAQIAAEGGGTYHTNHIFSTNPYEAVRFVFHNIAQGRVEDACGRFDEPIQTKFAQDVGQPDCKVAVEKLHAQVTNENDYAESLPSYVSGAPAAGTVTIDSCDYPIAGGPALGVFTVTQVDKGQWLITGHSPGPAKCGPASNSTPPTS